jgi:hypothetical protein
MPITGESFRKHLDLEWLTTDILPSSSFNWRTCYVCDDQSEKIRVNWPRGRCTVRVRLWLEIHSFAQLELSTLPRVAFEEAVEFPWPFHLISWDPLTVRISC